MPGFRNAFALETERLILRGWRESDIEPLHAICTDPLVMTYLGPPPSRDALIAMIERQNGFLDAHGACFWAVERREDGVLLGFCGLKPGQIDSPIEGLLEIGWRFRSDSWGKGYAREAALASRDWGFAHRPGERIHAITVPANTRSWGLMERIGMAREAAMDFDFPGLAADNPYLRHITYSVASPR